ncbi:MULTISPECIES: MaoC/PaaZ C-terminal domain-containing protein [unclassified Sporosarcina]|uniref:MaoC/PaaZ C-terminal domain-containing protein n=1 Tax=unclassified Sporosarcina TaxID=2647733 RepID=UPI001304690C|nr:MULTISPECIES: MaoC/PaaZ C-terminal domain-containing protein [unclassified Sporosarcina]
MYFDEFTVGYVYTTDSYLVSKEEIIAFASRYDPQDNHMNEQKEKNGPFKGIIASGLLTLGIATKLGIKLRSMTENFICGVGCDDVRFLQPVYPSDMLTAHIEVVECTPHSPKNDRGFVSFLYKIKNQRGKVVLTFRLTGLHERDQSLLHA